MSSIFISHRSCDNDAAAALSDRLKAQGHRSVFLDFDPVDGIPAGRDWEHELYRQLTMCRAVVVLCSTASMASKWCFAEIVHARALGKPVFPVKIDACVVHDLVADRQVIDLAADEDEGYGRLWRGLLAAGLDPAGAFDWDQTRPPYPGLLAFEERDAAIFFGRDAEITHGLALLNKVRRLAAGNLVMVVAASGAGKSSLVRAGLVPRLRDDTDRWIVVDPFRPRDDPDRELAGVLSRAFAEAGQPRPSSAIAAVIAGNDDGEPGAGPLLDLLAELRTVSGRPQAHILLIVDQFEEILGFGRDDPASRFLTMLRAVVEAPSAGVVVLGTMRSDFLGEFQHSPALVGVDHETLSVGPLSVGDLVQVIEKPAHLAGLELESGLSQAMVEDSETDAALPLLAFTLRELYERFGADGVLALDEYRRELGGLTGAIAQVAGELVESADLGPADEHDLRAAFLAMVRVSEDGRWARRTARWDQLPGSIHPVLERFVQARLLLSAGDGDERTLDVAHEALFRSWDLLAGWLEDDAEALRLRHEIERASRAYREGGGDPGDLWRGARLARAIELLDRQDLAVASEDEDFVVTSQRAEQAELEKRRRRRRRQFQTVVGFTIVTTAVAIVAIVLFFQSNRESRRANAEAEVANAQALASASRALQTSNPALALALAAESVETTPTPLDEATGALFLARSAFATRTFQPIGEPLTGHSGRVNGIAYRRDGELAASGGDDATVRLWDTATGQTIGPPLTGHDGSVFAVAFDPGVVLASAGEDGTVRLWDTATGQTIGEPLTGHTAPIFALAFDPGGGVLASAGDDDIVRLWDTATGQAIGEPLTGHTDTVLGVAFDADGSVLASAGDDRTVRFWDPASGEPVGEPIDGLTGTVRAVAFSPDGAVLAAAGGDGTTRLWDPVTREEVAEPLSGHIGSVRGVAFSPDGTMLASASADETVRLWELIADEPVLEGNRDTVLGVAFSPDGAVLATAGKDETVRLWDRAERRQVGTELTGHTDEVIAVAFSPDGTVLASASLDGSVRLWDRASGQQIGQPLTGPADASEGFLGVAFSPDGTVLAAAGGDGVVRMWDRRTAELIGDPRTAGTGFLRGVAFSPDGTLVASAGDDRTVRLWDPSTGQQIGEPLMRHTGEVLAVAFSPDGSMLASTSADSTLRLWDPVTRQPLGNPLTGNTDWVRGVAFSPTGMVATAGGDRTVRLWDPATGEQIGAALAGHDDWVRGVAFSPDGAVLASASDDRTVRLWDRPWDVDVACQLAAPYVRRSQLEPFLPEGQQPVTCDLP